MDRDSDNFVAEMLLKHLGTLDGGVGTTARGARVVLAEMRTAGIPVKGVRIVDGSGLSSLDRLTPAALAGVIRAGMQDPRIGRAFVASFAIAGRNGTLESRLPRSHRGGAWQDRDDGPRLQPLGRDRRRDRLLRAAERLPCVVLVGADRAGPLRHRARAIALRTDERLAGARQRAESSSTRSASARIGTPAFWAFCAFEPGLSPTITPAVFFETESETFAPRASRAALASSRV